MEILNEKTVNPMLKRTGIVPYTWGWERACGSLHLDSTGKAQGVSWAEPSYMVLGAMELCTTPFSAPNQQKLDSGEAYTTITTA